MKTGRAAWEVYSKTLAVALGVCALNGAVATALERVLKDRILCWAAAFATVQTGIIVLLSVSLLVSRTYARLKDGLSEQISPAIRDRVLALAFEGETWSSSVPHHGLARQVLEQSIAHTLETVKAAGRERVARFAIQQGFAAQWEAACYSGSKRERKRAVSLLGLISPVAGNVQLLTALRAADPAVRSDAYRALLVGADSPEVGRVFRALLQEPFLSRALLSDDLKRHAAYLLAHTIPAVLKQAGSAEAARCFEMLIAWKLAIPSFDIAPWLGARKDAALLPLVLALLPYVWTDESIEGQVGAALESVDLDVRCAAAAAAGRLRLGVLIPKLESVLGRERRLAVAAGAALGQMGEAGALSLERAVVGRERRGAAVAMEALERVTVRSL